MGSDAGNGDKIKYLLAAGVKEEPIRRFSLLLETLARYSPRGEVRIDLSLVRGLDYYTSTVFEFMSANKETKGSIGGEEKLRDRLIGLYSGRDVAATGASLGIDRMMNLLGYESSLQYTYAKVIVNYIREANFPYALKIANTLRDRGVNADINLAARNIANQFAYADSIRVGYAVIVGDAEEKTGKLKLRNLVSGEELMLGVEEAVTELSK